MLQTTKASADVSFGLGSSQEMCMDFVMYYPKENAGMFCGRNGNGAGTQCLVNQFINGANPGASSDGTTAINPAVAVGVVPAICPANSLGGTPGSSAGVRPNFSYVVIMVALGCASVFLM